MADLRVQSLRPTSNRTEDDTCHECLLTVLRAGWLTVFRSRASAREDLIKKGEYNSDSDNED